MKRLANTMNTSAQVLTVEHQIYADLPPAKDVPKFDIMELFAGEAEITQLAHRYGLRACQPFDILYGLDLKKPEIKRTWREAQDKFNPLLLVVETECTHWNIMNENLNYTSRGREETLEINFDETTDRSFDLALSPASNRLPTATTSCLRIPELQESGTYLKYENSPCGTTSTWSTVTLGHMEAPTPMVIQPRRHTNGSPTPRRSQTQSLAR